MASQILTKLIDAKLLTVPAAHQDSLRNKLLPKKIEVFVWRARKRILPTLIELNKRGIYLNSVRCAICDEDVECVDHSLLKCKLAKDIWERVFKWWNFTSDDNLDIENRFAGNHICAVVCIISSYFIWRNRNLKFFKNKCWNGSVALTKYK
ncbi:uncharacterized protein [Rutidosis leptorrhynchoides]|uniref:uncharacterized protein n=1 Tax=Rutidosis leptorrhynchoides TaxID=125765 RepID=UPI003A9A53E4